MLDKAELQMQLDRPLDAERTLLDALNARPTDEAIYAALLNIYDGDPGLMRNYTRLVRRMVETIPNARITKLVKIEHLLANRNYDAAENLMLTIEPDADSRVALQRMQLEIYIGRNRVAEATALIDQYLAEAGDELDDEMLEMASKFFRRQGDLEKSYDLEERRWLAKPPSSLRSQRLSTIHFLRGDYEAAARVIREALDQGLGGDAPEPLLLMLVQNETTLKNHAEAAKIAREALDAGQIENQVGPMWGLLGRNLYELERYEEALAAAERADELDTDPRSPRFNFLLAIRCLSALERLDEAERRIREAIESSPELGGNLGVMLAAAFDEHGHRERSQALLESLLVDFPNHPVINNSLGYSLANQGIRLQEAQQMIARALTQDPKSAAYLDSMGWVYYKMGQFDQALRWLQRRTKIRGRRPRGHHRSHRRHAVPPRTNRRSGEGVAASPHAVPSAGLRRL